MNEEADLVNLAKWTKVPAIKPTALRSSIARQEKGTHKVDELELKKRALNLVITLKHGMEIEDDSVRKEFRRLVANDIEAVIRDSGLSSERVMENGQKAAQELVTKAARVKELAAIRKAWTDMGNKLEAIEKGDTTTGSNDDGNADNSDASETIIDSGALRQRRTRKSNVLKRERDATDLDDLADDIKKQVKRFKDLTGSPSKIEHLTSSHPNT